MWPHEVNILVSTDFNFHKKTVYLGQHNQAEYCPTVEPSDRVDCAELFPDNQAVHNKGGCESLGCCHHPINVAGPHCFQAPWTPTGEDQSGKYLHISQLDKKPSSADKSIVCPRS